MQRDQVWQAELAQAQAALQRTQAMSIEHQQGGDATAATPAAGIEAQSQALRLQLDEAQHAQQQLQMHVEQLQRQLAEREQAPLASALQASEQLPSASPVPASTVPEPPASLLAELQAARQAADAAAQERDAAKAQLSRCASRGPCTYPCWAMSTAVQ